MKQLLCFFLLATSIVMASAQSKEQLLDSVFTALHNQNKFNGNVMIAEKGEVIYKKGFGFADESNQSPLTDTTIFELASCSKQFTAFAIAILQHQKKLRYDDLVSKYIPELSFYKGVTISHLIHHNSGLPDYWDLFDKKWNKNKIAANKDLIDLFQRYKPATMFAPNTGYEYSNTGYVLLAIIIERVSKISYGSFLKQYIFSPLHMRRSLVYTRRYKPLLVKDYAFGYVIDSTGKRRLPDSLSQFREVYYMDGITGDGTVNSTVRDLLLWDRSFYNNMLLNKKEIAALFEPSIISTGEKTAYGFGWELENNASIGKIVSHTGGWRGYSNFIEREPDQDKTIIILQNLDRANTPANAIRKILYNKPLYPVANILPDSILDSYTGKYLLSPGNFITVTKEGKQLKATAREYGTLDIFPASDTHFFLKVIDAELEFVKNEQGSTTKVMIDLEGRHFEARKTGE